MMRVPFKVVPRSQRHRFTASSLLRDEEERDGVVIGRSRQVYTQYSTFSQSFRDYIEFYYARQKVARGERLD